ACSYLGTELSGTTGSKCYCARTAEGPTVTQKSFVWLPLIDPVNCNLPCESAPNVMCGGPSALSVYVFSAAFPASLPANNRVARPWFPLNASMPISFPLGCLQAPPAPQAHFFPFQSPNQHLTPLQCVADCAARGYRLSATEGGKNCLCSHVDDDPDVAPFQPLDSSRCATPCTDHPEITCGGSGALAAYFSGGKIGIPYTSKRCGTNFGDASCGDGCPSGLDSECPPQMFCFEVSTQACPFWPFVPYDY
ncbi:hypothetical protein DFJ73DRAFT_894221, partial [Zopfochytrium polystomum]